MIDTHTHLDFENFSLDLADVLARFWALGGEAIVNIGVDKERNEKAAAIAEMDERIFFAVGFHPEAAGKIVSKEAILDLARYLGNEKLVAVGEIGLDYFHNLQNKKEQKELFVAQLEWARENNLPVILHCRDAYEDLLEVIGNEKFQSQKMVLHCYSGNVPQTREFLKLENVFFSFTGNITYPKKEDAEIFSVVKSISLDKIMVETDCPFLAPAAQRGKRNEPVFVKQVIEKIANIKELSIEEVERTTSKNARGFLGLDLISHEEH